MKKLTNFATEMTCKQNKGCYNYLGNSQLYIIFLHARLFVCVFCAFLKYFLSSILTAKLPAVMTRDNWHKLHAVLGPVEDSGCSIAVSFCGVTVSLCSTTQQTNNISGKFLKILHLYIIADVMSS